MPVKPIIDGAGWFIRNDSEYILDQQKFFSRPDYLEETDGYRDRASDTDEQVTRMYRCPWARRFDAREWLLGHSRTELVSIGNPAFAQQLELAREFYGNALSGLSAFDLRGSDGVARIRRELPAQDPERPWLFCDGVEVIRGEGAWVCSPYVNVKDASGDEVFDPATGNPLSAHAIHYVDNSEQGAAAYRETVEVLGEDDEVINSFDEDTDSTGEFKDGYALLRATFRPREYTIISDDALLALGGNEIRRYVTREEDFGMEALPLARLAADGLLTFTEGPAGVIGEIIKEAGVQQVPLATLNYTWHNVPDPPRTNYYACVGRINDRPFDGHGGAPTYPAETLLCLPWKLQRHTGPTGRITWTVRYRLSFRPQKWNRFPAAGKFYKATFGGNDNGDTVYGKANFNRLFLVPPPVKYIS